MATDYYFQNPAQFYQIFVDRRKLEILFQKYQDPKDPTKITVEGTSQFLDDLKLNPLSITVLILAWKFRAAQQCEFTVSEFINGMTELGQFSKMWLGIAKNSRIFLIKILPKYKFNRLINRFILKI